MKFLIPWLVVLAVLISAWWLRIHYIEPQELSIVCESGVMDFSCLMRKNLMAIFYDNAVGYAVFSLGMMALLFRSAGTALVCVLLGMLGMVIHGGKHSGVEYNSVGFVLGCLILARTQLQQYRQQYRSR